LKIPILGDIFRRLRSPDSRARFRRLLSSGVPILQSLDITARTSRQRDHRGSDYQACAMEWNAVKALSIRLKATEVFPHMVAQMIGIGEQTGALDAMLGKIADFYEQEVDAAIANLLTLMEPS
jgi:type IV pilus assembly protein PilC